MDAELADAAKNVRAVEDALARNAALEKDDRGYASFAERARGTLERMQQALELAKAARAFRKATVEPLAAGIAASAAAAKLQDLFLPRFTERGRRILSEAA